MLITASIWGNRFIIAAIIQGAIITGLTLLIVAIQLLSLLQLILFNSSPYLLKVQLNGSS
ncbi:MAG: hypothetical protein WA667_13200 [Candidatus Nitrosopolaris sp.]